MVRSPNIAMPPHRRQAVVPPVVGAVRLTVLSVLIFIAVPGYLPELEVNTSVVPAVPVSVLSLSDNICADVELLFNMKVPAPNVTVDELVSVSWLIVYVPEPNVTVPLVLAAPTEVAPVNVIVYAPAVDVKVPLGTLIPPYKVYVLGFSVTVPPLTVILPFNVYVLELLNVACPVPFTVIPPFTL
jgi:hypothetical protein